jgi:hypothetical protein
MNYKLTISELKFNYELIKSIQLTENELKLNWKSIKNKLKMN